MRESEYIDLAVAYVALSNAHKVELITPMFAENSTYRSAHVGTYTGRQAIGDMMSEFFSRFPDVRWHASTYRSTGERVIEFSFQMTATEAANGNRIERKGVEEIQFSDDGLILHLEVRKHPAHRSR